MALMVQCLVALLSPAGWTGEEKREEGKEEEEERKNGIAANKSKQDSEEDSLTALLPAPLDGGWGWVVLAASFVCSAVVEGLITLLGILLPDLLSHFGGTRAKTTIAGSLMTGSFLLTGPFVCFVLNKFGCRLTTMLGAVITTLALILSTFAPTLEIFILFYGAMAGLGVGFIYLPATVMVGFYFEKKRALATGIATSGAGAGLVIFSSTAAPLLEHWGWRFTLIVVAMMTLQVGVMGALMRPLADNYPSNGPFLSNATLDGVIDEERDGKKRYDHLVFSAEKPSYSQSCGHLAPPPSPGVKSTAVSTSCHHLHSWDVRPVAKPLMRDDIFYSGSIANLPEYKAQPDRDHYMMSYSSIAMDADNAPAASQSCWQSLSSLIDFAMLKNLPYIVILIANFLVQFAMFIPVVFIVDFALSLQVDATTAASLISAIGVSNAFGRALSGLISTFPWCNCLYLTAVSQFLVGLSTFLAPVLCYNYASLMVYAVVFGVSIGVFVPLTTVLLVQYVGLHRLTNAYGVLSMVKGVASLLGPPIAGAILDKSSSVSLAFSLAASVFTAASLVFLLVPIASKFQAKKSPLHDEQISTHV
ncbi:hypothetical protein CAPTEDRAFT_191074 [Capitella teleta]|uniref:Major facilitator superfamily (MFS) profile domain-containing protein n=1 Tax=Capitella teleta TaxID=283909 RepID=R7V314_CAPTE|nr:hypothetical protein CAPTEDRAFT_191074 [Capitella teleta]|eukprot:ELU10706.1 hypothetical protein CAPTEDRAFT_191074 [Capitella teleta]